jgi:SAM-dependent methyltransferase
MEWNEYLSTINSGDPFVTRYYHYMRFLTILKYFQHICNKKRIKRCLDIGCNRGYFSKIVADGGISVDAIDTNLVLSNVFQHPNINYIKTDIKNFASSGNYDLILFFEVMEHIPVEDRQNVLKKIHKLLAEDGFLIISGPNCISFMYGAGYCKEKYTNFFKHKTHKNWHYHIPFFSFQSIIESNNFVIKQWWTDGVFPIISNRSEKFLGKYINSIVRFNYPPSQMGGLNGRLFC